MEDGLAPTFPADAAGLTVGLRVGWGTSTHFLAQQGKLFRPMKVRQYATELDWWAALTLGEVDALYGDTAHLSSFVSSGNGYQVPSASTPIPPPPPQPRREVLERPYTAGGGGVPHLDPPPPLLPFQCLRLTANIFLRRLRCQEV